MSKNIYLAFLFIVLAYTSLLGQNDFRDDFRDGFIITLDNDTIRGQIDYRSNLKNYESCIFKGEQGVVKYLPGEINAFGYADNKLFSSQIVTGSFVEVLVEGKMNLYKSKDKYHIKKDTSLYDFEPARIKVQRNRNALYAENNRLRGIISYLVSDCLPNASQSVSNLRFEEKSLTRLVVKYNECQGVEFTELKIEKPWTEFEFGASVGVISSVLRTQTEPGSFTYLDDQYTSVDPSIGALVIISSPRISEKVAFQGEIHFSRFSYSSLVELVGSTTDFHDTFINLSTISLPVSLKYTFFEKTYTLYAQAGISYDYNLRAEARLITESVFDNVVNTSTETSAFVINNGQIGVWGGAGITRSFSDFRASIALRYFQMSEFNRTVGFTSDISRFSINFILIKK
ncbi:MAG: hypothetical protein AAFX87_29915 [Bacteroidota bacterium]